MSDENIAEYELKTKVINFLEIAYKSNSGITSSIVKSKNGFTIKVDDQGNAILSGKAGIVRFSVKDEFRNYGVDLKVASLMFSGSHDGKLHYHASFKFMGMSEIKFKSVIDVKKLILSCSGLLCQAARAMKNRHRVIDQHIQQGQ